MAIVARNEGALPPINQKGCAKGLFYSDVETSSNRT
jgi:hypothetical protein